MANTLLTVSQITRESLRILHQKLNFIGNINRQYDSSFAKSGAKIGDSLRIRLPNQYVVRSGATLSTQDTTEQVVTLQANNQIGVDLNFTSVDLTLSLDDFAARILDPAMSVLAANIESQVLAQVMPDVYNAVNGIGAATTFLQVLTARKILTDNLTPNDNNRNVILNTQANIDIIDAVKGLFNDTATIAKQYKEGMVGRTAGFDFYENTLLQESTSGSSTTATTSGAVTTNGSTSLVVTAAQTYKKGDVFTVAGSFAVHPETKVATSRLQQYVVTADVTAGTTINFAPAVYTSGPLQNVTAAGIPTGATLTKVGGASAVYKPSLAFHKDAFTFATADLVMPSGVDFARRETMDGISMRIVRQYDIVNDKFPCRLDVLWGAKTIRPQTACRILTN
jgi:hypothetical protein